MTEISGVGGFILCGSFQLSYRLFTLNLFQWALAVSYLTLACRQACTSEIYTTYLLGKLISHNLLIVGWNNIYNDIIES